MKSKAVRGTRKDIYSGKAADRDRQLFDERHPISCGSGYNSYQVKGDETICEKHCLYK